MVEVTLVPVPVPLVPVAVPAAGAPAALVVAVLEEWAAPVPHAASASVTSSPAAATAGNRTATWTEPP